MLKKMLIPALLVGLAAANSADAAIYGTDAPLTGTRNQADFGLTGNYVGDSLTLSWTITPGALYTYSYTFSGFAMPDISHFILDLTDPVPGTPWDPNIVLNPTLNGNSIPFELATYSSAGPGASNPGMPNPITGVKLDAGVEGVNVYTFQSNRLPVWGDFYVKGGNTSGAWNLGLETANRDSDNVRFFIARPNGVVPEPGSVVMVATGLGLLGLVQYRRRRNA